MIKKRLLFITEFTALNTGYAQYFKELLTELNKDNSLQIAELACVPNPHSKIAMADGSLSSVSLIKIGDEVLSHTGNSRKVSSIYQREYNGKLIKLSRRFFSYNCLELTENHPILVIKNKDLIKNLKSKDKYEWIPIKDVKVGDFVAYSNTVDKTEIQNIRINGYNIDLDANTALLFGWFLAEGYIGKPAHKGLSFWSVCAAIHEEFYIDTINKIIKEKFNLDGNKCKREDIGVFELKINNRDFCRIFTTLFGTSSQDKFISEILWKAPRDFIIRMMSAYFEGDGCSSEKRNDIYAKTVSQRLGLDITRLLLKHNIRCGCQYDHTCYLIRVAGEYARELSTYFHYKNKNFTNLYRKDTIEIDNLIFYKIKRISSREYSGNVYNFTVEEDNSYICDNFVVHNCYCHPQQHAQQISNIPWKVYHNLPTNQEEENFYNSNPTAEFASWRLENICLDFFPHSVLSCRDSWMDSFIDQSSFRKYYKTIFMPTVDASVQNSEWLDFYKKSDYILTYTNWAKTILDKEGGGLINTVGVGGYAVRPEIYRFEKNKAEHKQKMGIRPDSIIIGMIARNQKRKLYPELVKSFVEFLTLLNQKETKNIFLYWHTSYPDLGWNIPNLILNNGLSHKILFTYSCMNCRYSFLSFYKDARTICPRCHTGSAILSNSQQGALEEDMINIYNCFDLYVQYISNEGFGLPQVEAAMCGVPVCGTAYTATEEINKKLNGYNIPIEKYWTEAETGRTMAYPSNKALAEYIKKFISLPESVRNAKRLETRQLAEKHYGSWTTVAQNWMKAIDQIQPDDNIWASPPQIINIPPNMPDECNQMSDEQYVGWLLTNCLGEPRLVNSYIGLRMLRDVQWGRNQQANLGLYANDLSHLGSRPLYKSFNRIDLYNYIKGWRDNCNKWEMHRYNKIQQIKR